MDGNTLRFEYVFFRVNIYYIATVDTSGFYNSYSHEPFGGVVYLSKENAKEICDSLNQELIDKEQEKYDALQEKYKSALANFDKAEEAGVVGVTEPRAPYHYEPTEHYFVEFYRVIE